MKIKGVVEFMPLERLTINGVTQRPIPKYFAITEDNKICRVVVGRGLYEVLGDYNETRIKLI